MHQLHAIEQLVARLRQDPAVEAIFLKGSFGRGEEDVYSDIDLYCLVSEERMAKFLTRRLTHLSVYRPIIWKDDIFIVAPQLIVVYDDLLHVDLFTVTRESLNHSDTIRVLYDPKGQLETYIDMSSLTLTTKEAENEAIDAVWFLFQYQKAAGRGNALWAVEMLRSALIKFAKVLLHRYVPDRAQLGLKTVPDYLPESPRLRLEAIYNVLVPATHTEAARLYREFLQEERPHLQQMLINQPDTLQLLDRLLESKQIC
ncbi:DNA polymerase III subunit beta [Exiguobacterium sp. KRL4]|uniref:nucleotidyltransferase domain-containing protein n=1 Tax=Exiguobacterium sp. KRL4 TaxID=1914536 RepID=UPI0008F9179E|nr:nucleotidyltransferase domain-containing protein [Exiguobacterium sp. KRL4]OIN67196.1 DNA polymerase III subunit beta [Exiguobacterium sp. KRL4]